MVEKNWAGNVVFGAGRWHVPSTVEGVCAVVRTGGGGGKVRVVGTRHSFNGIADSEGEFISLERMNRVVGVERGAGGGGVVTVEAGVRYGELGRWLEERGLALGNLASLPHIGVAGAVATGTHGSGVKNGNLATAVVGMEMVDARGEVVEVSLEKNENAGQAGGLHHKGGDDFLGMVVGLGAYGVVTRLRLRVVETFEVAQEVFEGLSLEALEGHFDEIMAAGYSVSLFTDWKGDGVNQVWVKRKVGGKSEIRNSKSENGRGGASEVGEFFGARAARAEVHPIAGISAENCTRQMGAPGAWHERLPHFRLEYTPSSGDELQSEYFVPREMGVAALRAVRGLREKIVPLLWISEVRAIAGDGLWMSPCYGGDRVAIHFTWKGEGTVPGAQGRVEQVLVEIERALEPFGARPHWGKLFAMRGAGLERVYPRMGDFRELMRRMDPEGKFRNEFVEACIFWGG